MKIKNSRLYYEIKKERGYLIILLSHDSKNEMQRFVALNFMIDQ